MGFPLGGAGEPADAGHWSAELSDGGEHFGFDRRGHDGVAAVQSANKAANEAYGSS